MDAECVYLKLFLSVEGGAERYDGSGRCGCYWCISLVVTILARKLCCSGD